MVKLDPKKHKMFSKSKPFGYYPPEVEETIQKYENALAKALARIKELEAIDSKKEKELIHLRGELKSMHLEMSALELPEVDEAVASFVFDEFKNSNKTQAQKDDEWRVGRPSKKLEEGNPIKINSDDDDGDGFIIAQ